MDEFSNDRWEYYYNSLEMDKLTADAGRYAKITIELKNALCVSLSLIVSIIMMAVTYSWFKVNVDLRNELLGVEIIAACAICIFVYSRSNNGEMDYFLEYLTISKLEYDAKFARGEIED